jgi:hypothetical protein
MLSAYPQKIPIMDRIKDRIMGTDTGMGNYPQKEMSMGVGTGTFIPVAPHTHIIYIYIYIFIFIILLYNNYIIINVNQF